MAELSFFANRVGVIATMHRKEQAIAPLLFPLGIQPIVPENFDSDRFGTFSRDVPRSGDQRTAARLKAEAALELTGESLAIASEGTFGPHPLLPGIACNRELVLLLDQQHTLEIVGQVMSTDTNYRHQSIRTLAEALEFASKVGFPSHGLVVRSQADQGQIFKGITTETQLADSLELALRESADGTVHIETDMRALYNPTRMQVIAQASQDLVHQLHQTCPDCGCPGFSVVQRQPGLPCALCHLPTPLIRVAIRQCQACGYQQEDLYPQGLTVADPGQCAYCNP